MAVLQYKSVDSVAVCEFIERKSRFIGHIKPVDTEEKAIEFINSIKEKYWDATHNVYAYVLLDSQKTRYSDDSEPHGTAGMPVLDVLQKNNLKNVVVVVTRYFGGTLLGTGGLVRSYSKSALMALEAAGIADFNLCCECELISDYSLYGKISRAIFDNMGSIDNIFYTSETKINFHIPLEKVENFVRIVEKITSKSANLKIIKEKFYKCEKNKGFF